MRMGESTSRDARTPHCFELRPDDMFVDRGREVVDPAPAHQHGSDPKLGYYPNFCFAVLKVADLG